MMKITYNSTNKGKRKELEEFYNSNSVWFKEKQIEFEFQKIEVRELQTGSLEEIVKHKTKMAYSKIKRPVLVEHTCLKITALNDLPGHLTGEIWNTLGGYKICELVKNSWTDRAEAVTILGYCDGKKIRTFEGSCRGRIAPEPRGNSDFQWDTIFIPDGQYRDDITFAEMTESKVNKNRNCTKTKLSMRTKALELFLEYLKDDGRDESLVKQYIEYQKNYEEAIDEIKKLAQEAKAKAKAKAKAEAETETETETETEVNQITKPELALFIGAGLSRNIELPTWNELINEIGEILGYEEDLFFGKANVLELASFAEKTDITHLIREVFRIDKLENSESSSNEKPSEVRKKIDELVENKYMKPFKEKLVASPYYSFLARLKCKTIYTTNYDRCIEEALMYSYMPNDSENIATCVHSNVFDELRNYQKEQSRLNVLEELKKKEKANLNTLKEEDIEEELLKLQEIIELTEKALKDIKELITKKLKELKKKEASEAKYLIHKFHGDLKYESELVLTNESYDQRYGEIILNLEYYKDCIKNYYEKNNSGNIQKNYKAELKNSTNEENIDEHSEIGIMKNLNLELLKDLCEKSILFIGYGFGDCDVNKLISFSKTLRNSEELKNKIDKSKKHYAFMISPNEVKEKWLIENDIIPIIPASGKINEELEAFLRKINED